MGEGGSIDGGDDDDVGGGDGKRKADCEGEAEDDHGGDNYNGSVDNEDGVDINDSNDANGGDGMTKTDRDDDADGGGGNSNDDGVVDGTVGFEKWCVDGKGGDEADDGDEQIEIAPGDLAECNGSSKMELRVGVMR